MCLLSALCEHNLLELVSHALLQELPVEPDVVGRHGLHCLMSKDARISRRAKEEPKGRAATAAAAAAAAFIVSGTAASSNG